LEIEIVPAEVRTAADLDAAYQALASTGVQAVVVEQSGMLLLARKPIAQAAASKRVPTVYGYREHVEAGGLLSYGVNLAWPEAQKPMKEVEVKVRRGAATPECQLTRVMR
jgi:putative tryptophan/tyrosine transport system substrate-binding protein